MRHQPYIRRTRESFRIAVVVLGALLLAAAVHLLLKGA